MWIQSFLYYPDSVGQTMAIMFSRMRIQSPDVFVQVPHTNFLGPDPEKVRFWLDPHSDIRSHLVL